MSRQQKLQHEIQAMNLKVKKHEQNLIFLESEMKRLDVFALDMRGVLAKLLLTCAPGKKSENLSGVQSEEEVLEQILKNDKSAASVFLQLKTTYRVQASIYPETKDVVGILALLGKVDDDNLSGLLSHYLGKETILAIVCKTFNGVQALVKYDKEGKINTSSGIHGISASFGEHVDEPFTVICLESMIPYHGEFVKDDPQRRLDLAKPRLPNLETPAGFLGYAVNMINLDSMHLTWVMATGHGLRETLFYNLFSTLQVYKTREDMFQALPCIDNGGAISLDGGIVERNGVFSLGKREIVDVKFFKRANRLNLPEDYAVTENKIKEIEWKKERTLEDMKREQELLDRTRFYFEIKKQEFAKFSAQASSIATQNQL